MSYSSFCNVLRTCIIMAISGPSLLIESVIYIVPQLVSLKFCVYMLV